MVPKEDPPAGTTDELQRLKAENEILKQRLQRLNSITMANADVAYKMSADWSNMLELSSPDFLADTREPDHQWIEHYIIPSEREKVMAAIQKAIQHKEMFELEHRVIKENGDEGWTLSRAIPVFDAEGNITEWLGLAKDISSQKKVEQDLLQLVELSAQRERLYETITGSTPDLVYVFDLDANFSYANAALLNMWGRTKENSFGKSLLDVGYEPWHAEMHQREIAHIRKTKEVVRGEVAFPHATLGKRVYDYILVPVLDAMGEVTAVAGTTRDITEIRLLSEQKDEFLAIASHELKTPLTSLKAYGQVLQSIFADRKDEEAVMMLGRMDNQVNKLTGLIAALLDVTRIQSGKLVLNNERFNLSALTGELVDELQLTSSRHILQMDLPGQLSFYGDRERIGQVITNLVANAIKYSPAGGEVNIRLREEGDRLLLSVEDSGVGIPAGMHSKIFEQFYRANNYRHAISGMGIGLYIAAEIVERSGGNIWAKSNEGSGAVFYVSLPVHKTADLT